MVSRVLWRPFSALLGDPSEGFGRVFGSFLGILGALLKPTELLAGPKKMKYWVDLGGFFGVVIIDTSHAAFDSWK